MHGSGTKRTRIVVVHCPRPCFYPLDRRGQSLDKVGVNVCGGDQTRFKLCMCVCMHVTCKFQKKASNAKPANVIVYGCVGILLPSTRHLEERGEMRREHKGSVLLGAIIAVAAHCG